MNLNAATYAAILFVIIGLCLIFFSAKLNENPEYRQYRFESSVQGTPDYEVWSYSLVYSFPNGFEQFGYGNLSFTLKTSQKPSRIVINHPVGVEVINVSIIEHGFDTDYNLKYGLDFAYETGKDSVTINNFSSNFTAAIFNVILSGNITPNGEYILVFRTPKALFGLNKPLWDTIDTVLVENNDISFYLNLGKYRCSAPCIYNTLNVANYSIINSVDGTKIIINSIRNLPENTLENNMFMINTYDETIPIIRDLCMGLGISFLSGAILFLFLRESKNSKNRKM